MKKSLNGTPNVFIFALRGSIAGAAIGFVAAASVTAILLGYECFSGEPTFDSSVLAGLSRIGLSMIFGGGLGIFPGGVAGFCGALAFAFSRSRTAIMIYAGITAAMTILPFQYGFHDAALYLVLVFACGGGFVFANVLQWLRRSMKLNEECFAAQFEKRD